MREAAGTKDDTGEHPQDMNAVGGEDDTQELAYVFELARRLLLALYSKITFPYLQSFVTFRAAKGGTLFQRLTLVMWVLWNAFLTNVVRPIRGFVGASLGGGKGSTTITLQNGTRY